MQIDQAYYKKLHAWFNADDNRIYKVKDMTDNPEKLIAHVKHYIDNRVEQENDVVFNNDYTLIIVLKNHFGGLPPREWPEYYREKHFAHINKLIDELPPPAVPEFVMPQAKSTPIEAKPQTPNHQQGNLF